MTVSALLKTPPAWVLGSPPESEVVVASQCAVARNFDDFPFPARCSHEEKRAIEERVAQALEHLDMLETGAYFSLPNLSPAEAQFLAERRFITWELLGDSGPRGVFVTEDQSLSLMVNGSDHVCIRALQGGLQLQEAWAAASLFEESFGNAVDFAYQSRLGYLTADLGHVGTGLVASVLLHLPALAMNERIAEQEAHASGQRLALSGVKAGAVKTGRRHRGGAAAEAELCMDQALYTDMAGGIPCAASETVGDLYLLCNESTLGESEQEIVFRVRHAAGEIVREEHAARQALLRESSRCIEDRAGRARGVASGARLLDFEEAVALLSDLRLGADTDLPGTANMEQLNGLLLASQGGHLQLARSSACDSLALSIERADLFRSTFDRR